ncbi:copper resistance D family protein [Bacillus sp. FJAT-45037]|uniref:copper resistance D family protein n=1 Tax=Bacillus sp. FJAT-45037 TaxID=2011007 RepID=UPI000C2459E2|nr:CopD family protein [Bacillus sp. FJAT-45037]
MVELSQLLLMLSFLLLVGYHLLLVIPQSIRPSIHIPKKIVLSVTALVPVLLLVPVYNILNVLVTQFSIGLAEALPTVFLTYAVGQSALISFFGTIILFVLTYSNQRSFQVRMIQLLLVLVLVLSSGWASHAASIAGVLGFISNSVHLLAVSAWIGPVFVIAWFSRSIDQKKAFAAWFSPLAVLCVLAITATGLLLMGDIVPQYVNSWMITYGQLLLIKHILFIPLLILGFRHSFLMRSVKKGISERNLMISFKIESIVAILVLAITTWMTEQTPPHEVIDTLQTESISPLFSWFVDQPILPGQTLSIEFGAGILISLMASLVLFLIALFILVRSSRIIVPLIVLACTSGLLYFSLMMGATPIDMVMDETVYATKQEAISATYSSDSVVTIHKEEELDATRVIVIYTVDQADLVAQVLEKTTDGMKRLPASMLTIGGSKVTEEDQKIRTFRVQSGAFSDLQFGYTYVTFGMIQEPVDVARVQIHYEGGSYISELEQQVFINRTSSDELWNDQHPIDFLLDDGTVIETYARQVMEEGVYCH